MHQNHVLELGDELVHLFVDGGIVCEGGVGGDLLGDVHVLGAVEGVGDVALEGFDGCASVGVGLGLGDS